jgi:hypothetical protein
MAVWIEPFAQRNCWLLNPVMVAGSQVLPAFGKAVVDHQVGVDAIEQ